jgi:hypothetical protein
VKSPTELIPTVFADDLDDDDGAPDIDIVWRRPPYPRPADPRIDAAERSGAWAAYAARHAAAD